MKSALRNLAGFSTTARSRGSLARWVNGLAEMEGSSVKQLVLAALIALLAACDGQSSSVALAIGPLPKVALPAYDLKGSGPIVVVMNMAIADAFVGEVDQDYVAPLLANGFSVLSLDLPCQGADAIPGVEPLDCWRQRIDQGDSNLFTDYCAGLAAVLDKVGAVDASVIGISRGGYVAITCAAYDPRLTKLALIAPVTDLAYLTEFSGDHVDEQEFGTAQYIPYLQDRRILVRVGRTDTRVGTGLVVNFANLVHADLEYTDGAGHDTTDPSEATVAWLISITS
jgi:pimeloyl-ACP methyl ester carboxylesterase